MGRERRAGGFNANQSTKDVMNNGFVQDDRLFYLDSSKDSDHSIRLLPPKDFMNPKALYNPKLTFHRFKYLDQKGQVVKSMDTICPSVLGQECPICQARINLFVQAKEIEKSGYKDRADAIRVRARKYATKERMMVNVRIDETTDESLVGNVKLGMLIKDTYEYVEKRLLKKDAKKAKYLHFHPLSPYASANLEIEITAGIEGSKGNDRYASYQHTWNAKNKKDLRTALDEDIDEFILDADGNVVMDEDLLKKEGLTEKKIDEYFDKIEESEKWIEENCFSISDYLEEQKKVGKLLTPEQIRKEMGHVLKDNWVKFSPENIGSFNAEETDSAFSNEETIEENNKMIEKSEEDNPEIHTVDKNEKVEEKIEDVDNCDVIMVDNSDINVENSDDIVF